MLRFSLAPLALALALSACVQTPTKPDSAARASASPYRGTVSINGISVRVGGTFERGEYASLPRVRTIADVRAIDKLVAYYQGEVATQLRNGDYEAALTANHLAAKFIDYQTYTADGTRSAVQSLLKHGTGQVDLSPGSYMVLPSFDRFESDPEKYSFSDWPYGPVHHLAMGDTETKIDAAMGILNLITGRPSRKQRRQSEYPAPSIPDLATLPLNQPVTLQNGAVLERTKDAFVLHNPGNAPLQINVKNLGYLPPVRKPSVERIEAGRILEEMNEALWRPVLHGIYNQTFAAAPNKMIMRNRIGTYTGGFNVHGQIGTTKEEINESFREYHRKGSPFNIAIDARVTMQESKEAKTFVSQCLSNRSSSSEKIGYDDRLVGVYGEIVDLRCLRGQANGSEASFTVIHSRRFYVTDRGNVQTWESLLKDKDIADQLSNLDDFTNIAENIAQLIPVFGNMESGLKCVDMDSVTRRAINKLDYAKDLNDRRVFVADRYSMDATPSAIEKTADCAGALPLLGTFTRLGLKAQQIKSLGKYIDTNGKQFAGAMSYFDTTLLHNDTWAAAVASLPLKSAQSMTYAKKAYDSLQHAQSISDASDSIINIVATNSKAAAG